jgi:hypothetical protein
MTRWRFGLTAALIIGLARVAQAQAAGDAPPTQPDPPAQSQVDVSRLPISLERIQRQLRQTTVREERDGLNLRYIVDVYGQAPRIELFTKQDNLFYGSVPRGAPTHQDMLNVMTPQEFSSPAANVGNLFNWLSGRSKK